MVKNEQKFAKIRKNVQKSCKNAQVLSKNLQKWALFGHFSDMELTAKTATKTPKHEEKLDADYAESSATDFPD